VQRKLAPNLINEQIGAPDVTGGAGAYRDEILSYCFIFFYLVEV
jgi:hypothetical protein